MKTEIKNGVTYVYPEDNKKLKLKNSDTTFSIVILAKDDSVDNYEEVDSLWEPNLPNISDNNELINVANITPDIDGKLSYEDASKLINTVKEMQSRMISLQETNNILLEKINSKE